MMHEEGPAQTDPSDIFCALPAHSDCSTSPLSAKTHLRFLLSEPVWGFLASLGLFSVNNEHPAWSPTSPGLPLEASRHVWSHVGKNSQQSCG